MNMIYSEGENSNINLLPLCCVWVWFFMALFKMKIKETNMGSVALKQLGDVPPAEKGALDGLIAEVYSSFCLFARLQWII